MNEQKSEMNTAISGVRVIEISELSGGACCAQMLAWLGADVVKLESPSGASARYATTEKPGVDSFEFILLNSNKRSVTCDLNTERGNEDLRKLIAKADVVVEHLVPGAIEHLGFGYDTVKKINPRIIYAQLEGFAAGGSRANYLCSDKVGQSIGGAVSGTGYEGGPPLLPGSAIGDTGAALHATMGILAALHQRAATGRGQRVQVAMQDAVINLHRIAYINQSMRGKRIERLGNGSRSGAVPSNLYPCNPGGPNDYVFIHISKTATKHLQALLKVMGREELISDPKYATAKARGENAEEIDALVTNWCKAHGKIDAMESIQNDGATAGAVLDPHDLSRDPHLRKGGMIVTIDHPARGAITIPGWPVKMSESHVPVRSAPLLGEHTKEVMSEWLGAGDLGAVETSSDTQVSAPAGSPGVNRALAGVKVVDLTQFEAGTSCTEALAWLGADVVKIEEPERGERGRYGNTDKPGVDAHYFIFLNANKRSLTCDLKSERDKDLLRQLIMKADVMVENMAPGVIERLGFGYDEVRKLNPRIIFAQLKGFASDGARAKYLCFDTIAQAAGGSVSVIGTDGRHPLRPGPNIGDTGAGMHCATGIVAALCQRLRTGRGQRVQVAMQEGVLNFTRMAFANYLRTGKPSERRSNRELFQCKGAGPNNYCFVAVMDITDEQWQRLLRVIGKQDLIGDRRFANAQERDKNYDAIETILSSWCSQRTKVEAMDALQGAGVPAGAVLDTQELNDDKDLRKSGMFVTIDHPARGALTMPAWPVRMSESNVPVRVAPLLGAHTEEVLSEWLGLSKQQLLELRKTTPVAG